MSQAYHPRRYAHSAIDRFVSQHRDMLSSTPLVLSQASTDGPFQEAPGVPDGSVDLLYCFSNTDQRTPALGFQQVDGEQDEEAMYSLVYLDPHLTNLWNQQVQG